MTGRRIQQGCSKPYSAHGDSDKEDGMEKIVRKLAAHRAIASCIPKSASRFQFFRGSYHGMGDLSPVAARELGDMVHTTRTVVRQLGLEEALPLETFLARDLCRIRGRTNRRNLYACLWKYQDICFSI